MTHQEAVWEAVRALVIGRDTGALADRLIALTDAERADVARRLPGFVKELREGFARPHRDDADEWDLRWLVSDAMESHLAALRLVGAGTIPGPAGAVAWLTRREFNPRWAPDTGWPDLARVLVTRPAAWRADVAARLARKIRRPGDRTVPLVLALLRSCGGDPPAHDPLVVAWLAAGVVPGDPLAAALLPRIFDAQGAGRTLRDEQLTPRPTAWLSLLASGVLPREAVLDGCVGRFLRGGDALDLRFFVRLHKLVDPTPEESAARSRDYLRLLPAAPGTVAELALAQVRRTGPHDAADVAEAIGALTFRAEAKLALAGLSWLDDELRHTASRTSQKARTSRADKAAAASRADELAPALATAFAHPSYQVQERAARLALKHAAAFGTGGATVAEAVPLLPPDLGRQVAERFGGDATPEEPAEPFTPLPLPVLAPPGPFPEPTLAADGWAVQRWETAESWLAAFVEQAARDRAALRAALTRATRYSYPGLYESPCWLSPGQWIGALADEVIAPGSDPGVPVGGPADPWESVFTAMRVMPEPEATQQPAAAFGGFFTQLLGEIATRLHGTAPAPVRRHHDRLPEPGRAAPPHLFVLRRLAELYAALREGALPPVLLATPTLATGHLDPAVLVDRLEACAAAGVEPLPADLAQALLRLPRGAWPEAAERAARVGSRGATQAAAWLAGGGLPDPVTGLEWGYRLGAVDHVFDDDHVPEHTDDVWVRPVLQAGPTGDELIDELLREPRRWSWGDHADTVGWWPAILPSHREVVAVNLLPWLFGGGAADATLAALAQAGGPVGEATAINLARSLTRPDGEAAPLLLRMAARGDLPAEAVGRQLAHFVRRTRREVRPAFGALADAARQGAHAQVWEIVKAMLPDLLAEGERPAAVHTEAVTLAVDVAAWAGARDEIPTVTAWATSRSRSRFARECRRLRDQLSGASR
ncbi:hypothetical protein [Nonomuraea sp. NPDC049725]|uniref:hypothetical protein n=1 Tax=Nonomuraea sp. NPDC049725 TaxID=3154508 RepID=UPI0034407E0C